MGGHAFQQVSAPGEPTLVTPRMPPEIYHRLRSQYLKLLRDSLGAENVEPLIEAPEKPDHGDIDFITRQDSQAGVANKSFEQIAEEIGAAALIVQSPLTCNFAVRVDGARSPRAPVLYRGQTKDQQLGAATSHDQGETPPMMSSGTTYAQIDLEKVPSDHFTWMRFHTSYGDVAVILGHMLKPLGLSIRRDGLFLRLIEWEILREIRLDSAAVSDGLVFLSRDPTLLMEFLGLSEDRYEHGFTMLEQLYEWLVEGRFCTPLVIGAVGDLLGMRKRVADRTVFSGFWAEWLPSNRPELFQQARADAAGVSDDEIGPFTDHTHVDQIEQTEETQLLELERKEITSEAMVFFQVSQAVSTRQQEIRKKIGNVKAAELVKPIIAKHNDKSPKQSTEVLRAFRRFVDVREDGTPFISPTAYNDSDSKIGDLLREDLQGLRNPDELDIWVGEHWREVHARYRSQCKESKDERLGSSP